ncbi:hypothetical protein M8C21_008918 [Ambrosia artemisiifolia]|uniref:Uncharacterized protein n=1 Tax=Ambrosia artemisiifolia TaxID=4212 RepID=A0AAD5GRS7_AMBAR|nr:hypothetical protein M8C21_008918 [Ambrosia artemisiifolia]
MTTATTAAELAASNGDDVENGLHEEEFEAYAVYTTVLTLSTTHALLEKEQNKFEPVQPNCIQCSSIALHLMSCMADIDILDLQL